MRGLGSCRLVRQDLAQPDPPRAHRVFVLSGKRGGTRAGCAHGMEAQQPGGSPGVGGSVFPPGEQAPLSLWGQHTPLSASWKTCRFGQGLSSATSSCLAPPAAGEEARDRRLWTGLVRASGQQTVVHSQRSSSRRVRANMSASESPRPRAPGCVLDLQTLRYLLLRGPTAPALWEGRAQLPWRCAHAAGA